MHFQPSPHSYGNSDYGFWTAAAYARRRDRQRRKAGRDFDKYEECVAEGKGSKCDKYKDRGQKHLAKARDKDEKVKAKGKHTKGLKDRTKQFKAARAGTLGMTPEEAEDAGLPATPTPGAGAGGTSGGMNVPSDEELAMETGDTGSGSGSGMIFALLGLAVIGGGAFFFYKKKQAG